MCTSERELEVQQEEVDVYSVEKRSEAYKMALSKDWKGFKQFYDGNMDDLFSPLTVNGDNAFHFAAASNDPKLVKALLDMVPDRFRKLEALMKRDDHENTALHEVATTNCVEAAVHLVEIVQYYGTEDEKKLLIRNKLGETPLYRAAALGKTRMVKHLASKIDPNVLHCHFSRRDKISILHIAVIGQHFDTAIWLLKKEKQLLGTNEKYSCGAKKLAEREENNRMTCFNLLALMPSAFHSSITGPSTKLVHFFLPKLSLDDDNDEDDEEEKLSSADQGQDLEKGKNRNDNNRKSKNQTAISKMQIAIRMGLIKALMPSAFSSETTGAFTKLIHFLWPKIEKICEEKKKHELALKLAELLVKQDTSWKNTYRTQEDVTISLGLDKKRHNFAGKGDNDDVSEEKEIGTEAPLVMAASNGITEIFDLILKKYPQAIDYVSEKGQNILHAAIKFRQTKIFNRILEKEEKEVERLAARIDIYGYTVLHHAADMYYYRGGTRPGPALQYQEELEWSERVKQIMPSHYTMHRNKKKTTAADLFEGEHTTQLKNAQEWMKNTSASCSTVAILVATVVFAAAYTVPGGNNDQGIPVFLHSPLFWVFTIMDVVSLISSLSSVVMFLSILTSPFNPEAFLKSLPRKLTIGFALLFFSVFSSMITFTAALLLLIRLKRRSTATLVYIAAFIPVVLFALMQLPLCASLLGSLMDLYKTLKWNRTKKKPIYLN